MFEKVHGRNFWEHLLSVEGLEQTFSQGMTDLDNICAHLNPSAPIRASPLLTSCCHDATCLSNVSGFEQRSSSYCSSMMMQALVAELSSALAAAAGLLDFC